MIRKVLKERRKTGRFARGRGKWPFHRDLFSRRCPGQGKSTRRKLRKATEGEKERIFAHHEERMFSRLLDFVRRERPEIKPIGEISKKKLSGRKDGLAVLRNGRETARIRKKAQEWIRKSTRKNWAARAVGIGVDGSGVGGTAVERKSRLFRRKKKIPDDERRVEISAVRIVKGVPAGEDSPTSGGPPHRGGGEEGRKKLKRQIPSERISGCA